MPIKTHDELIEELMAALDAYTTAMEAYVTEKNAYCKIVAEMESRVDDNGKAISSVKAQALAEATLGADIYRAARAKLEAAEKRLEVLQMVSRLTMDHTVVATTT